MRLSLTDLAVVRKIVDPIDHRAFVHVGHMPCRVEDQFSNFRHFWEHDFDQSVGKHKKFLQDNLEDQNNYSSRFSQILNEMNIFQNDENSNDQK